MKDWKPGQDWDASEHKPVALMDVDGVLNLYDPYLNFDRYEDDVNSLYPERSADPNLYHVRGTDFDVRYGSFYNVDLGMRFHLYFRDNLRDIIARLLKTHSIVWATSWDHLANTFWIREMGLSEDLPVLRVGRTQVARFNASWKTTILANLLPENIEGMWFDDEVTGEEHKYGLPLGIKPVTVDYKKGLSMSLLDEIGF